MTTAQRAASDAYVEVPRPLFVGLGSMLSPLWAALGVVFALVAVFSDEPVHVNSYDMRDPASYGHVDLWLILLLFPLSVALSWGLWRRAAWARHVMFAFPLTLAALIGMSVVDDPRNAVSLLFAAPYVLGFGWYLYIKRNVVAYFRSLRSAAPATESTSV